MAVLQISRIQIRRGQKNTGSAGIPQLASGELAWAIDTQELYIGNGAVSEGAPAVGNTKIITANDNLLELVGSYQFARNNPAIQTGVNANNPILLNLQDVIDQFTVASYFGATGDGTTDDTASIQRAIDQLFLNPNFLGSNSDPGAIINARVELQVGPGVFVISNTIYLPSYVFITGSGAGKTIFQYTGTDVAFKFVNSDSRIGAYTTANTTQINQPKFNKLRDFTVQCLDSSASGMEVNSVCDSIFNNIEITGAFAVDTLPYTATSYGMKLTASHSDPDASTTRNEFDKITVNNFANGLCSDEDIQYNSFTNCDFSNLFYGVNFGENTQGGAGQLVGPSRNSIVSSNFKFINRNGIFVKHGTGNSSSFNKFEDVGNDGGGILNSLYPIINFVAPGNSTYQDTFDRKDLAVNYLDPSYEYAPEVSGTVRFNNINSVTASINESVSQYIPVIRIPTALSGSYEIDYIYTSTTINFRKGTMSLTVDLRTSSIHMTDDYETTGTVDMTQEALLFKAELVGTTIVVSYINANLNDIGKLTYTTSATTYVDPV